MDDHCQKLLQSILSGELFIDYEPKPVIEGAQRWLNKGKPKGMLPRIPEKFVDKAQYEAVFDCHMKNEVRARITAKNHSAAI